MKNIHFGIRLLVQLAFLTLIGAVVVLVGFWLLITFIFPFLFAFTFPENSSQTQLLDNGESYTVKIPVMLGGDGAQCFEIYKTGSPNLVGKGCSDEGFSEKDPTPLEIWAADGAQPKDLVMFYKPSTKQLFLASNDCEPDSLEERQDKEMGISVRVPRSLQQRTLPANSGNSLEMIFDGEASWCTAVPMQHSIRILRSSGFEANVVGEVKTSQQMETYLSRYSPRFEVYELGTKTFFIVTDTIHGAAGGPKEYVVWFATGSGPVYRMTFDRYMNLGNVKSFLNSMKFL